MQYISRHCCNAFVLLLSQSSLAVKYVIFNVYLVRFYKIAWATLLLPLTI
jgi:hypothetical protein